MRIRYAFSAATIVAALAAGIAATPAAAEETLYMAGIIDCVTKGGDAGAGDRTHDISCVLDPGIGAGEVYFGVVRMKSLSTLGDGSMQWMAFTTRSVIASGALAGKYRQVTGDELWYGLGADALIDSKKRIVLQPVAGRKDKKDVIAAGVESLELASLGN